MSIIDFQKTHWEKRECPWLIKFPNHVSFNNVEYFIISPAVPHTTIGDYRRWKEVIFYCILILDQRGNMVLGVKWKWKRLWLTAMLIHVVEYLHSSASEICLLPILDLCHKGVYMCIHESCTLGITYAPIFKNKK
jgi:hypothetical protein